MKTSLGRTAAVLAIALPLVVAPVAVPAAEALPTGWYAPTPFGTFTPYGWSEAGAGFGWSEGGAGYGTTPGQAYGQPYNGQGYDQSTGQSNATAASSAQSSGLVMVNTVLDYGQGEAAGTGLVIGADGIVVTNHHVVQDATTIKVTTPAGATYTASVIGYDKTHDVAVLKLAGASGLTTVTTDTATPSNGAQVDAVGNAEGQGSLTDATGTVLNPSTSINVTEDDGSTAHLTGLIEVSSDVVPGDSGGALRETNGNVIGMNVAASSGSANPTGYAIPIARVVSIANEILAGSASATVTIGNRGALGIEVYGSTPQVAAVEAASTAKAGLQAGDTITSVDGTSVSTTTALTRLLTAHHAGDTVSLTWTDQSGHSETAQVTLIAGPVA